MEGGETEELKKRTIDMKKLKRSLSKSCELEGPLFEETDENFDGDLEAEVTVKKPIPKKKSAKPSRPKKTRPFRIWVRP